MTYLLLSLISEKVRMNDSDFLYTSIQKNVNQIENYPRLRTLPGAYIIIKYFENDYITPSQNQKIN
jgi:hypothetical protein